MSSRNSSSALALVSAALLIVIVMCASFVADERQRHADNRKLKAEIDALKVKVHDRLHQ